MSARLRARLCGSEYDFEKIWGKNQKDNARRLPTTSIGLRAPPPRTLFVEVCGLDSGMIALAPDVILSAGSPSLLGYDSSASITRLLSIGKINGFG